MSDSASPFTVIAGGGGEPPKNAADKTGQIESPATPPGASLSPRERKVWDYICKCLREAGLEHYTCGLTISVICRTYCRWLDAEDALSKFERENGGYFVTTPNGHAQPHQAFYVARNLKSELLKWLPESCLTLPSVAVARSKMPAATPQDDLFDSLVGHGRSHPSVA